VKGWVAVDNPAKGREPERRSKLRLSIRARLIVLALFALAPLMFQRVHGLETARAQRTERARSEVIDLARRGTESQREIVSSVRSLLQVLARVYPRMPLDAAGCNQYLTDMAGNIPWLRGLSVAGTNGQIKCSTEPTAIGLNVSDRPHFQNALNSRDFALSDYLINRTRQLPSLIATYPAIGNDGAVNAVVLAVINLEWIGELAETAAQRSGASVLLLDGSGTLLAASRDEETLLGKQFGGTALVRDMLANDQGEETTEGLDGVRRIFSYVRVPWTQARLAVGLDDTVVQSGIDHELSIAYLQLAAFAMFVLLVAWFGGEQLIVRPIRSLVRTATRFGRGDLQVRATQDSWPAEFEPLAIALDDMARKLAGREEELQIANQHLEELASLDGLTGLANRRGFDRRIELEWKNADEHSHSVALMMIDIDHFKLYNDRYGHVAGDTCLRSVAETLSLVTLEDAVLVTRYGGEEFALLLPGLDLKRASERAEEVRRSIEELSITHAEAPCGLVTVSVGVQSIVPQPGQTAADLVEAADRALYVAKRRGRNRVVAHGPTLVSTRETEPAKIYPFETKPPLVA
jgi:diguanylate cyclase (GGDEF)-like protein